MNHILLQHASSRVMKISKLDGHLTQTKWKKDYRWTSIIQILRAEASQQVLPWSILSGTVNDVPKQCICGTFFHTYLWDACTAHEYPQYSWHIRKIEFSDKQSLTVVPLQRTNCLKFSTLCCNHLITLSKGTIPNTQALGQILKKAQFSQYKMAIRGSV